MKTTIIIAQVLLCLALNAYADDERARGEWQPVSGSGVHYFSTSVEHSRRDTANGYVLRTTDIVELTGDLNGKVLYHPRSVFDFVAGKLVNTGHQVFSGTVLGVGPVLIHDDEFRFKVNLFPPMETVGRVFLVNRIAGPRVRCHLRIAGTGVMTPEGDAMIDYTGKCRFGRKHGFRGDDD